MSHQTNNHNDFDIEYISNVIESIPQNIVVMNIDEHIVIWNSNMESQFYPKKEAIGKSLRSLFPTFWEEFRGKIWGEILRKDVIKEGKKSELARYPLKTKKQKIRYFDLRAKPLKSRDSQIMGCVLIMNDVTDKINLENKLIIQARTTSLANLGASVAHEIRNPLNSISLNIQLIKEGLEYPEYSSREESIEIVANVLSEINRLNSIITNFLEFSRPPTPSLVPGDLNETIRQKLKLLGEEARRAHVDIIFVEDELPLVALDRNQFSQAIYNIVLNAIQAMKEQGGGILEVTTQNIKEYVLLEIKDNGPGIKTEAISRLFDLFFSTKQQGTGLGLPIANRIIEQHDGRLVAENNLDRGACFSIYLPVLRETK